MKTLLIKTTVFFLSFNCFVYSQQSFPVGVWFHLSDPGMSEKYFPLNDLREDTSFYSLPVQNGNNSITYFWNGSSWSGSDSSINEINKMFIKAPGDVPVYLLADISVSESQTYDVYTEAGWVKTQTKLKVNPAESKIYTDREKNRVFVVMGNDMWIYNHK